MIRKLLIILGLIACLIPGSLFGDQDSGDPPFRPGETLHFKLKWGIFNVGRATLETRGPVDFNGQEAYQFIFTVRTNKWADAIFKVRDRTESYVDIDLKRSLHYAKDQSEGSHRRNEVVTFDWEKKTVQYRNFDKEQEPLALKNDVFDPLSVLYIARLKQYEENGQTIVSVTDGKSMVEVDIKLKKRETLKVRAGTFDTILLEPDTKDLGGVFKKSDDASIKIWFSDDERKIPVKLKSKVAVGHFVAELIDETEQDDSEEDL